MNEYRIFKHSSLALVCCLILFFSGMYTKSINAETKYSEALQKRFQDALNRLGPDYKPRTELLLPDGKPKYTNRLVLEHSPYLVQNAHSPVNWYSWGGEAFAKAKTEVKPIFLSIGYSSCFWCHVVEQEIFNNEVIAKYLNEHFINIKVDREQRPDLDVYYMNGAKLTTGQGGWPMPSFLMPDGRPFFAGSYFPTEQFRQLLERISFLWDNQQQALKVSADRVASVIAKINSSKSAAQSIDRKVINAAVNAIMQEYDDLQGGFNQALKFPNEPSLFLLLKEMERGINPESSLGKTVIHTLNAMAQGGLYDQIGGGFHRYAIDDSWLIPHFEKMLYSQAHLTRIYLQAHQLTGDPNYERVARQTLDYLLREMKAPSGGFYSATTANIENEEAGFYLWKQEEIILALPDDLARLAIDLFGVSQAGNFENRNILHLPVALNDYAKMHKIELSELFAQVDKIRMSLRKVREKRSHPHRDDKIVTAWNSMVISTLVEAGRILNYPGYLDEAKRAAEFLWQQNRQTSGQLFHVYHNGTTSQTAALEDYAYFAEALLRLYDATGDEIWLQKAKQVSDIMLEDFWDKDKGGFIVAKQPNPAIQKLQSKELLDAAIPSGNSMAVRVLTELSKRTGKLTYQQKAMAAIAAFSDQIAANPETHPYLLLGVDQLFQGETGDVQYAANGAVTVQAELETAKKNNYLLKIELSIKPGWRINAHTLKQKDLIATEVSLNDTAKGWQLKPMTYPKPLQKKLEYQQSVLAVYEGKVQFRGKLIRENSNNWILPVKVSLQACNDQYCLAPETLHMKISAVIARYGA